MAKEIKFGADARAALESGVNGCTACKRSCNKDK